MTISLTSDLLGIVLGGIAIVAWMTNRAKLIRQRILEANQDAEIGKELSAHLLSKATNPERRADIHAFIQIRTIEIDGRRTRAKIESFFMCFAMLALGIVSLFMTKSLFRDSNWIPIALIAATYLLMLISFFMALIYGRNLRTIEDGWMKGVKDALETKVDQHLSK